MIVCALLFHVWTAAPAAPGPVPAFAPAPASLAAQEQPLSPTEILERAARFQRGDAPRPTPRTFHGRFHARVETPDGDFVAKVERWFSRNPLRLRTTRSDDITGLTTTVGFDGTRSWFRDEGTGEVKIYSDRPDVYGPDLEFVEEQLRLTRLVLETIALDPMISRLREMRYVGAGTWTDLDKGKHLSDRVAARMPDDIGIMPADTSAPPPMPGDPPPMLDVDFIVDRETGALWSVQIANSQLAFRLNFDYYGPTPSGIKVPGNIQVYVNGETIPKARLGVEMYDDTSDLLAIELDVQLEPSLFEVPAGR